MIEWCQDSLHAFQGTRFEAIFSGTYEWSSQSARKVPGLPSVFTANTNLFLNEMCHLRLVEIQSLYTSV